MNKTNVFGEIFIYREAFRVIKTARQPLAERTHLFHENKGEYTV